MAHHLLSLTGYVGSKDIQVLSIDKGYPLCRFSLVYQGQKINCLISKRLALQALFELRYKDRLQVDVRVSSSGRYWVLDYKLVSSTYSQPKHFID